MPRPWPLLLTTMLLLPRPLPAGGGVGWELQDGTGQLAEVVRDLQVKGYPSTGVAIARVQAAAGRLDAATPLALRRLYHTTIGRLASTERQPALVALAAESAARLEEMAAGEGCRGCELDALLIEVQSALTMRDNDDAARLLAHSSALSDSASMHQQQWLYVLRGRVYRAQGRFDEGVAALMAAVRLAEQLGHTADRAAALSLLMTLNSYLGDHARAETTGLEAYRLASALGNRALMAGIELNRGFNHALDGQAERQLAAYNRALAITEGDSSLDGIRAIALSNYSDYWLGQSDWKRALDYAERSVELSRATGDAVGLAYALTNRGVARAHLVGVDVGARDVREAMELAGRQGMRSDLVGITQELVGIYEHAGRYREAFTGLRSIEPIQQEISRQSRDRAVLELQEQYSAASRQREIERLADANRVKEAELEAQRWQRRLGLTLTLALTLAAGVLVRWLARVRHANRRLSDDVALLAEQSAHDPLTGAFNRRQGHALLAQHGGALREASAEGAPSLGIVLLDLDFFKQVNDNHGHAAGDRVLVEVARRLRALLDSRAALVRWGGEEFLILMPDVHVADLPVLAGQLLRAVGDSPVPVGEQAIRVTASAGCLASPFGQVTDMEELVQLADLALYRAKETGRNRAVCLGQVAPWISLTTLGQDLGQASRESGVELEVVPGPDIPAALQPGWQRRA